MKRIKDELRVILTLGRKIDSRATFIRDEIEHGLNPLVLR